MSGVYGAALALSRRGIPCFPCTPNAKPPLTAHGLHDASSDPQVIERWARRWPTANLGLPTGWRSGFIVVDIDVKAADGFAAIETAEERLGPLPQTLVAATPSGGQHRYFRMPEAELRNSAGKLGPGIDVRGEGGYVLMAPSVVAGAPYRWHTRMPPAALPETWLAALLPPPRALVVEQWAPRDDRERSRADTWCVHALQREFRNLADTPPGARNDRLWRAAAALGGLIHHGAISADDIRSALQQACSTWLHRDTRKDAETLERGLAFGLAHPRQLHLGDIRAA